MKFSLFFILIISILLAINCVSAVKLGLSPGILVFNGSVNEKICRSLTINTDYEGILIGESNWIKTEEKNRNINDYTLSSEDLDINMDFPDKINMTNNLKQIEICISAKKPGNYNGAVTYKTSDSYAGVGSWIEAGIIDDGRNNPGFNSITSSYTNMVPKKYSIESEILIISLIILFIGFLILFSIHKKREKHHMIHGN